LRIQTHTAAVLEHVYSNTIEGGKLINLVAASYNDALVNPRWCMRRGIKLIDGFVEKGMYDPEGFFRGYVSISKNMGHK
jgi:hypothetical protein